MFSALTLAVITLLPTSIQANCPYGCTEPTLIYNHLKCKPVYSGKSCCPEYYDCSQFLNRPKDACHLIGEYYKKYDEIPNEIVSGTYSTGCKCFEFNNKYEILCGSVLCPEFTGKFKSDGCFPKYDLHTPCAIGEVCSKNIKDSFNISNGVRVYKNQKFNQHPCKVCVYESGYNGKYPYCKESCMPELTSSEYIDEFCAPVYISKFDCCPVEWICTTKETILIKRTPPKKHTAKCLFGNQLLEIGETFEKQASSIAATSVHCQCKIPPYVTCYWKDANQ